MKDIYKILYFLFIGILISIYGCEDDSSPKDENKDPDTGLRFVSTPVTTVNPDADYTYVVVAVDYHSADLIYQVEKIPSWLSFNDSSHILWGRPTFDHVGSHSVIIRVSNNISSITQSFSIEVSLKTAGEAWSVYTKFKWTHNGRPYNSEYCIVYTDGASEELKTQVGMIADENFNEILQTFNFNNFNDFRYPPGYDKIEIYINRFHDENIAWAYWGGFIITIRPSNIDDTRYFNYVDYTSKHELTHVFEFLIEGHFDLGTPTWFREGIAVHIGNMGTTGIQKVDSQGELESWIEQYKDIPGEGNPIKIKEWEDFPQIVRNQNQTGKYYPLFCLALEYLISEKGAEKSYQDVLNLFYDVRNGIEFPAAFQQNFGINLKNYETEFYERMRIFLSS
ncbi:MAG: hypothetical protein AMS27_16005 [Bacteroides sp. SM23_62_1]|nr:MAG: hypothetical protein AMS27_16005 [Bacteroides sp. SM23_62_1]